MKKVMLKAVARLTERSIKTSNNSTCFFLSYQPKAPKNIKKFTK